MNVKEKIALRGQEIEELRIQIKCINKARVTEKAILENTEYNVLVLRRLFIVVGWAGLILTAFVDPIRGRLFEWSWLQGVGAVVFATIAIIGHMFKK